ncbi:MAG: hypothetical protein KC505_01260 [Myxococcales bacterium]|nr:hypothetical protein [Myxococcales bacterium]USN51483.1 MAG: hypothetical protein H6731_03495 [Myxococcales bacterium]
MTKAQGDKLSHKVNDMEGEVAKLQRVRHDMEILLSGQVRDLFDRLARLENQLNNIRQAINDGSSKNLKLITEVQDLRGELEEAQHKYRNLEQEHQSLAKNQLALKKSTEKIKVPPLKDEHFALAKKLFAAGKYNDSIYLADEFIKEYAEGKDKDALGQMYFLMGENNRKLSENKKTADDVEKYRKTAVVNYQKIVELFKVSVLREEALYQIGSILKEMGNSEGAKAAFRELLSSNEKSKRAQAAKKHLASLEK